DPSLKRGVNERIALEYICTNIPRRKLTSHKAAIVFGFLPGLDVRDVLARQAQYLTLALDDGKLHQPTARRRRRRQAGLNHLTDCSGEELVHVQAALRGLLLGLLEYFVRQFNRRSHA